MKNTVSTKPANTSQYRSSGKPLSFEQLHQDLIEGTMPNLVAFAQENPHQYRFTDESRHNFPRT
jgi:hypothetical protein